MGTRAASSWSNQRPRNCERSPATPTTLAPVAVADYGQQLGEPIPQGIACLAAVVGEIGVPVLDQRRDAGWAASRDSRQQLCVAVRRSENCQ